MNVEQLESQAAKAAAAARAAEAKATEARAAREQRVEAALLADTDRLWSQRRIEVRDSRDKAEEHFQATVKDPESTLLDLWDSFTALKETSAIAAAVTLRAISSMNQYRPRPSGPSGAGRSHSNLTIQNDPYKQLTFADVLTHAANHRAELAATTVIANEADIRENAIEQAENG